MPILTIVLNQEETTLGKTIMALGHMTFGLGHQLSDTPEIRVYFGTPEAVKAFHQQARRIHLASPKETLYSDFMNLMSGGDTDHQTALSAQAKEDELHYYGACFVGEETAYADLNPLLDPLKGLPPFLGKASAKIIPHVDATGPESKDMKICLIVHPKAPLTEIIPAMVSSCLEIGRKTPVDQQRLINFKDASGTPHDMISYHPFVSVKPESNTVLETIATAKPLSSTMGISSYRNKENMLLTAVVFGQKDEVEQIVPRGKTRLFQPKLDLSVQTPAPAPVTKAKEPNPDAFFNKTAFMQEVDVFSTTVRACDVEVFTAKLPGILQKIDKSKEEGLRSQVLGELLHEAAGFGNAEIVEHMLKHYQADISHEDLKSAQQYAQVNGYKAVEEVLSAASTQRVQQPSC